MISLKFLIICLTISLGLVSSQAPCGPIKIHNEVTTRSQCTNDILTFPTGKCCYISITFENKIF